jgi:hypothetical protein
LYYALFGAATIAKRNNMSVALISERLRHSNLKTTQIYLASLDNDDALDAAIVGGGRNLKWTRFYEKQVG